MTVYGAAAASDGGEGAARTEASRRPERSRRSSTSKGRLLWFHPLRDGVVANDFRVAALPGRAGPDVVGGQATGDKGYGEGTWVIADRSYREIARVRAGNGLTATCTTSS